VSKPLVVLPRRHRHRLQPRRAPRGALNWRLGARPDWSFIWRVNISRFRKLDNDRRVRPPQGASYHQGPFHSLFGGRASANNSSPEHLIAEVDVDSFPAEVKLSGPRYRVAYSKTSHTGRPNVTLMRYHCGLVGPVNSECLKEGYFSLTLHEVFLSLG